MRRPRAAALLVAVGAELLAVAALAAHAAARSRGAIAVAEANRDVARELRLTSLSLWSEPRYARHPAEADPFAPFADHPAAIEHFPAGSIVPPRRAAGEGRRR